MQTPDSPPSGKRPGQYRVLAILVLAFVVLTISIIGMSTREPGNEFRGVSGIYDAQRIFGGEFQMGDRLGPGNAPVRVQVFTDVQAAGPAKKWEHTHSFVPLSPSVTEVREHIEYEHQAGLWGIVTRLLFSWPNLLFMFGYRKWATRRALRRSSRDG